MTEFTPKYIAHQHKLLDRRKDYDPHAAKYLAALAEIERLQEIERKAITQSEHIQKNGLTDFEVAGLRATLEWYANEDHYDAENAPVQRVAGGYVYDRGYRARKALEVTHV